MIRRAAQTEWATALECGVERLALGARARSREQGWALLLSRSGSRGLGDVGESDNLHGAEMQCVFHRKNLGDRIRNGGIDFRPLFALDQRRGTRTAGYLDH